MAALSLVGHVTYVGFRNSTCHELSYSPYGQPGVRTTSTCTYSSTTKQTYCNKSMPFFIRRARGIYSIAKKNLLKTSKKTLLYETPCEMCNTEYE